VDTVIRRLAAAAMLIVVVLLGTVPAVAAPTPTPNAVTTGSPKDSDPDDYNKTPWVVIGAGIAALVVGAGTFWLIRTRQIDLTQESPPDDDAGSSAG